MGTAQEDRARISQQAASEMLNEVDRAAGRVLTAARFPKWWLVLYVTLPAIAASIPLLIVDKWIHMWVGLAAFLLVALFLYLTWPRFARTGLGQDERLKLKNVLILPVLVMLPSITVLRAAEIGRGLLGLVVVFAVVVVLLSVYATLVLRWFRVRVRARVFDFTENEAMWDGAQKEIARRVAQVKADDRAAKADKTGQANRAAGC